MNISLGRLPVGEWRDVTKEELEGLKSSLKDSDNSSYKDRLEKGTGGKRRRERP